MKFKLYGSAIFDAENLDDAFRLLSVHFRRLTLGEESNLFDSDTDIHLERIEKRKENYNV